MEFENKNKNLFPRLRGPRPHFLARGRFGPACAARTPRSRSALGPAHSRHPLHAHADRARTREPRGGHAPASSPRGTTDLPVPTDFALPSKHLCPCLSLHSCSLSLSLSSFKFPSESRSLATVPELAAVISTTTARLRSIGLSSVSASLSDTWCSRRFYHLSRGEALLGVLFRHCSSEHGRARACRGHPSSIPFLSPVWCASAPPRPGEAEALANGAVGDPDSPDFLRSTMQARCRPPLSPVSALRHASCRHFLPRSVRLLVLSTEVVTPSPATSPTASFAAGPLKGLDG
jgi:hypothetical protein